MKKKADISINIIIIAAIALIVLVVLIYIFAGRMGIFSKGVASCPDKNGACVSYDADAGETPQFVCDARSDDRKVSLSGTDCSEGKTCCVKL